MAIMTSTPTIGQGLPPPVLSIQPATRPAGQKTNSTQAADLIIPAKRTRA